MSPDFKHIFTSDFYNEHIMINLKRAAVSFKPVYCRFCGSASVVKYGFTEKSRQRWLCMECTRTFIDNDAPPRMRYSTEVIAAALHLFYEGHSLQEIQHQIDEEFSVIPHQSSIYDWIMRYTKKATDILRGLQPRISDTLVIRQTKLSLKNSQLKEVHILDCIDHRSSFLLATRLIRDNSQQDVFTFIDAIRWRIRGAKPKVVFTDEVEMMKSALAPDYNLEVRPLSEHIYEQFNNQLQNRSDVIYYLNKPEIINFVISGWMMHYNYFRPNEDLNGITPAYVAGITTPFNSWADTVH
jgi:transposase-like protein